MDRIFNDLNLQSLGFYFSFLKFKIYVKFYIRMHTHLTMIRMGKIRITGSKLAIG